ncbi:MAG: Guanylate cyclase-related protein [uncultured Sulfurovum sp.]|uniref:Guanylate cyclase-related protein n=1 Tax=uncultured Sulfurovum sp. TaxID=269237 RepID=A0A6S6T2D0_9BACT|nr:MAG: Guanylate cyclase-related protein [uncultured Sulfurovum sp.]
MRGIIFTELYELVEEKFGYELLDDVLLDLELTNDGAYTATGNYPFSELLDILIKLHEHTKIPIEDLLEVFGEYLFTRLLNMHPELAKTENVLEFLEQVETYIHIEVKKLYPDAELPKFNIVSKDEKSFKFYYISSKKLHHLAKGLIQGLSNHYKQPLEIKMGLEDKIGVFFEVTRI